MWVADGCPSVRGRRRVTGRLRKIVRNWLQTALVIGVCLAVAAGRWRWNTGARTTHRIPALRTAANADEQSDEQNQLSHRGLLSANRKAFMPAMPAPRSGRRWRGA